MARNLILATIAGLGITLVGACRPTHLDAAFSASLEDVDAIRDNGSLGPQEKRDALADLGFDAVTINGLLADVRLANQFGGDLSTAYEKVVNDEFAKLTPDEVQVYGDATGQTTYSDDEAQAIVSFFQCTRDPTQVAIELDNNTDRRLVVTLRVGTSPNDTADSLRESGEAIVRTLDPNETSAVMRDCDELGAMFIEQVVDEGGVDEGAESPLWLRGRDFHCCDKVTFSLEFAPSTTDLEISVSDDRNQINSASDLQDFLDAPADELPDGIDETDLTAVFITTSPDDVRDQLP